MDTKKLRELAEAVRKPFELKPELDAIDQWHRRARIEEAFEGAVTPATVLALLDEIEGAYGLRLELQRLIKRITERDETIATLAAQLEDAKNTLELLDAQPFAIACLKRLEK